MLGGSRPSEPTMRNVLSFVEQEDEHLIPTLTVRETLRYAAGLRLPSSMSAEHKIQSAESVIERLNLQACANTMVGGSNLRGISRGEKRRVSIGVQLLNDPHILILDEPTSGLDAFTARSIIDILRSLAVQGKTIILSIHQPRSDMFQYFGNILLLSRGGQPMYAGKASAMLPYFSKLGYDCPPAMNPADFVLDLVTVDLQHETVEAATGRKVSALAANWASQFKRAESSRVNEACATARVMSLVNLTTLRRGETPLHIAVPLLLQRSAVGFRRKAGVLDARIAQVFGFAVITTLFWAPLKNEDVDIQSRVGFIQHQMGKSSHRICCWMHCLIQTNPIRSLFRRYAPKCGLIPFRAQCKPRSSINYIPLTPAAILLGTRRRSLLRGSLYLAIYPPRDPIRNRIELSIRRSSHLRCRSPTLCLHVFHRSI